jgi:hypothetical protein
MATTMTAKAPLQIEWQRRVGIVRHLQEAGGRATKRHLFNLRPRGKRSLPGDWDVALRQLVENDVVAVTGTGKRGDPVVVALLHDLPSEDVGIPVSSSTAAIDRVCTPKMSKAEVRKLKRLARRFDDELALEVFVRDGINHEIATGKRTREYYEERAREKYGDGWRDHR